MLAGVASHQEQEQALGRISPGVCPEDCARKLLDTLLSQAFLEELAGEVRGDPEADEDLVAGVLATLWRALRPVDEMLASSA